MPSTPPPQALSDACRAALVARINDLVSTDKGTGRLLIAVDGQTGSGKTQLARYLGVRLPAVVIGVDDLFPGWDGLSAGLEILREQVLRPLRDSGEASYPTWDWHRQKAGPVAVVPPGRLVIVEGCGASAGAARDFYALTIWLTADRSIRRRRGVERDGAEFDRNWTRWESQEDAVFGPDDTGARADLRLSTNELP